MHPFLFCFAIDFQNGEINHRSEIISNIDEYSNLQLTFAEIYAIVHPVFNFWALKEGKCVSLTGDLHIKVMCYAQR